MVKKRQILPYFVVEASALEQDHMLRKKCDTLNHMNSEKP